MTYNDKVKRSRLFEAKWAGTCKKCNKSWSKGVMLCYEGGVLVHANCPSGKSFRELLTSNVETVGVTEEDEDTTQEANKKPFLPSPLQQAIFDWGTDGEGNAVAEAVAGSGKTTTIVNMLDILPSHLRILFVAFNKGIVKELKSRLPQHIRAVTLNSLGFSVIRKLEDFQELDPDKVSGIMNEFWAISKKEVEDPKVRSENRIKRAAMRKIVGLVKNTLADYNNPEVVLGLINRYHVEIDELMEQEVIEKLPYVMEQNNGNLSIVDYDDQIYLPVINPRLQNKFDQYDFILGDECQDWNAANIQLVLKHLAPGGRILAVGDRKQSIHGFRGADTQAIPHLIEWTNAKVLPLSVCYRCPSSHIEDVKHLVPQIEPAPGAKVGTKGNLKYEEMMELLKEGDMVLCRTNAPLVKPAFACIKSGRKAIIKGKDIGKDLVNYIDRFQCDELGRLDVLMQEHTEHEIARYLEKNKEMMAEQVKERYETIMEVSKECKTVEELVTKLTTLFSDDNIGVVFSSVHRAKGLEAERVFLYKENELMPHPKAKGEEELEQEDNLIYVARTRSKDTIYYVKGEE
jgi:DNA helicase II / ATP-dependent DNA helicase PcrA